MWKHSQLSKQCKSTYCWCFYHDETFHCLFPTQEPNHTLTSLRTHQLKCCDFILCLCRFHYLKKKKTTNVNCARAGSLYIKDIVCLKLHSEVLLCVINAGASDLHLQFSCSSILGISDAGVSIGTTLVLNHFPWLSLGEVFIETDCCREQFPRLIKALWNRCVLRTFTPLHPVQLKQEKEVRGKWSRLWRWSDKVTTDALHVYLYVPGKDHGTFTSTIQVTEKNLWSHFSSTDTLIYIGNKPGRAAAGWAGSGYRAGGLSEWKSCHTLIMQQLAQSACSQEIRTRRGFSLQSFTGSFSHTFNTFTHSFSAHQVSLFSRTNTWQTSEQFVSGHESSAWPAGNKREPPTCSHNT